MKHHLGAGDAAVRLHARDNVERDHRVARRRDDIEGREYVGYGLVAPVDRNRRRRAFLRPEPLGARIDHRHHVGRQTLPQLAFFRQRGRRQSKRNQRRKQQREATANRIEEPRNHSSGVSSGLTAASYHNKSFNQLRTRPCPSAKFPNAIKYRYLSLAPPIGDSPRGHRWELFLGLSISTYCRRDF